MKKVLVYNRALTDQLKDRIDVCLKQYGFEAYYSKDVDDAVAHADDAEIIYGKNVAVTKAAANVKWIHLPSAGVDPFTEPGFLPKDCLLSNSAGTYGVTVSEHMVMLSLMSLRHMENYRTIIDDEEWKRPMAVNSLYGAKVLVFGTGDIGQAYAQRLRAFEPEALIGFNRTGKHVEGFDRILPISGFKSMTAEVKALLAKADIIALILPSTPETKALFNKDVFDLMTPGKTVIVNAGRGDVFNEEDLIQALTEGQLAGAALDVASVEPLPKGHPLWHAPHLILTPHTAGNFTLTSTLNKNVDQFLENFKRYCEHQPLIHQVNMKEGY